MSRLRPAALSALLAALALVVAACGGSDEGGGEQASAETDVDKLLTQTFTGAKKVESGKLAFALQLDAQGGSSQVQGPISASLKGPFKAQGDTMPAFKLDLAFEGAGQSLKAGATSTGQKGFVNFQGTDYAVSDQVFRQFRAGYEEARKQGQPNSKQSQSFASLGMDPRKWLTSPANAGEAKVGDDDTIKITGGVDVAKLLDDVNKALAQASSLGLSGTGQVPSQLTDAQKRQAVQAIKDPRVEIYSGKDDQILRRLVVKMGVDDTNSKTTATVGLDLSITDLNEDQEIAEPSGAKPFDQLLGQLGGLGALGGGSSSSSGGAAGSQEDLEQYSKCITEAGSDNAKARACADLLAP